MIPPHKRIYNNYIPMKDEDILDVKKIPKNPILFGIAISKLYKKWSISALIAVFFATALSRYSVVVLLYLTNSLTATPFNSTTVVFWPQYMRSYFWFQKIFGESVVLWGCDGL